MTRPRRRSIRLQGYDYAQPGTYFVTCCAYQRQPLFGEVLDGAMVLNGNGYAVLRTWQHLPNHYPHVMVDAFVVMPNHVHGVVVLAGSPHCQADPDRSASVHYGLPEIVRALKTYSARLINQRRHTRGERVWQRGYYDHIVRSEHSLRRIREYIAANPALWGLDAENPESGITCGDAYYRAIVHD